MDIIQESRRLAREIPGAVWYGFGSYFGGQGAFSDIDILVICQTTLDAILVRAKTEELCARWPLHLVIMTKAEQMETGFVTSEGCMMLMHPLDDPALS